MATYHKCARDAGCAGLKKGIKEYHACAKRNNCGGVKKPRKPRAKTVKPVPAEKPARKPRAKTVKPAPAEKKPRAKKTKEPKEEKKAKPRAKKAKEPKVYKPMGIEAKDEPPYPEGKYSEWDIDDFKREMLKNRLKGRPENINWNGQEMNPDHIRAVEHKKWRSRFHVDYKYKYIHADAVEYIKDPKSPRKKGTLRSGKYGGKWREDDDYKIVPFKAYLKKQGYSKEDVDEFLGSWMGKQVMSGNQTGLGKKKSGCEGGCEGGCAKCSKKKRGTKRKTA